MKDKTINTGIISLGCPKNLADMEAVFSEVENAKLVNIEEAEIVFLNTCGFLKAARDEVFENLKKLHGKKVIILGCLASDFPKEEVKKYPQIHAIVSSANYQDIQKIFDKVYAGEKIFAVKKEPKTFGKFLGKSLLSANAYAYIKIAEGCWNKCSYCMIPYLKGAYRSREMEEIIEEAKSLIALGIKEIILVAQDCGYYGSDLYGKKSLATLLKKLAEIKGDFWIRTLYIYPEMIDEELLKTIKSSDKICKYLDIPLQHGDSNILEQMRRPNNIEKTLEKIKTIRKLIPEVTLRTSFIVGFPGETTTAYKNLLEFIKKIKFNNVGIFEYSREPHTTAFYMKNQLSDKLKKERKEKAMLLQQKISLANNKKFVGKTMQVLIEKYDPIKKIYTGHSQHHTPEVDGQILIKSRTPLKINEFVKVKITKANTYDLFGMV
ncbi:MAG: 30S ribosomal protein S12 methylthiotransferase RimO [Candidatus Peregrinibacteria bacterium]|nr:30S ribosomal protein S12 methylthiotransferase RimO [Candidatus Peregrinibacteria bacterium]